MKGFGRGASVLWWYLPTQFCLLRRFVGEGFLCGLFRCEHLVFAVVECGQGQGRILRAYMPEGCGGGCRLIMAKLAVFAYLQLIICRFLLAV